MARVTPNDRLTPRVVAVRGDSRVGRWCVPGQASAAVMPTVDSMTGFIFLSSAS